nr:hypothetical protein [Tanacetum cinerariifolium]
MDLVMQKDGWQKLQTSFAVSMLNRPLMRSIEEIGIWYLEVGTVMNDVYVNNRPPSEHKGTIKPSIIVDWKEYHTLKFQIRLLVMLLVLELLLLSGQTHLRHHIYGFLFNED